MSERIIVEDKNWEEFDVPQFFLFRAMSSVVDGGSMSNKFKTEEHFPLTLDVCLTINGVEVSFSDTVQIWYKMFEEYKERTIKKEAIKLLGDKGQKLFETLDEITNKVKENLQCWE